MKEERGNKAFFEASKENRVLPEGQNRTRREQSSLGTLSSTFNGGTACDLTAVSTM